MVKRTVVGLTAVVFVLASAGFAHAQDRLQNYLSDAAMKVKVTPNPVEKREILDESFDKLMTALNTVQHSPLVSKEDKAGIEVFKNNLKEKQDELAGVKGFEPVPDAQLNAFADYVVQDAEQAERTISISVVTLLLIIIIIILLA